MKLLDSLVVRAAYQARVPAGQALAVDREAFAANITTQLNSHEDFELVEDEVVTLPSEAEIEDLQEAWVVASGPLTADQLSTCLMKLCLDESELHFYDAIAPVIDGETINYEISGIKVGRR